VRTGEVEGPETVHILNANHLFRHFSCRMMYRLAATMHNVSDKRKGRQTDRRLYHANSRSHRVQQYDWLIQNNVINLGSVALKFASFPFPSLIHAPHRSLPLAIGNPFRLPYTSVCLTLSLVQRNSMILTQSMTEYSNYNVSFRLAGKT